MSVTELLSKVEASSLKTDSLDFEIGDTVDVHCRILEGDKERVQVFNGIVISRRGRGTNETFTVRRIVNGEGVERVFPVHSPKIAKIEVLKRAIVRRAKLYYLRDRIGKSAVRLKERPIITEKKGRNRKKVKKRKAKATSGEAPAAKPKRKRTRKKKTAE